MCTIATYKNQSMSRTFLVTAAICSIFGVDAVQPAREGRFMRFVRWLPGKRWVRDHAWLGQPLRGRVRPRNSSLERFRGRRLRKEPLGEMLANLVQ